MPLEGPRIIRPSFRAGHEVTIPVVSGKKAALKRTKAAGARELLAQLSKAMRTEAQAAVVKVNAKERPVVDNKKVELFFTKLLSAVQAHKLTSDKLVADILDKDRVAAHSELSPAAIVTALGSIAVNLANPALMAISFEVLSKLTQAANHPIAEMASQQLIRIQQHQQGIARKNLIILLFTGDRQHRVAA